MQIKVLFVIGDTGSAHYCIPLWEKWKKEKKYSWKILTLDFVTKFLNLNKFSDHFIKDFHSTSSVEQKIASLDWEPNLVFSSASFKDIEVKSMIYAKQRNIRGVQFFDTWYNYYKRLVKQNNKVLADKVCLIDKLAYNDAISEGIDKTKLVIIGQPYLERIKLKRKFINSNDNIMFINQPISKYKEMGFLNYNENDVWRIVSSAMKKVRDKFNSFFFAKHPQEKNFSIKKNIIKELGITLLDNGQDGLEKCDTFLGIFSSLMFDAFLKDKNVISVQPKYKTKNLCMLSRCSYIKLVSDEIELEDYLKKNTVFENKNNNFQYSLSGSLKRLESFLIDEKKN